MTHLGTNRTEKLCSQKFDRKKLGRLLRFYGLTSPLRAECLREEGTKLGRRFLARKSKAFFQQHIGTQQKEW